MKKAMPFNIPCVVNGQKIECGNVQEQRMPSDHQKVLGLAHSASQDTIKQAINGALAAKKAWEDMPFADRAAIFLKAADLLSTKYR